VNPHLTYHTTIAQFDELRRKAANHRLTRASDGSENRPRMRRRRLPVLAFTLRPRQRVA
jgi:hypothetical protein